METINLDEVPIIIIGNDIKEYPQGYNHHLRTYEGPTKVAKRVWMMISPSRLAYYRNFEKLIKQKNDLKHNTRPYTK